jgi:hypothetical protein
LTPAGGPTPSPLVGTVAHAHSRDPTAGGAAARIEAYTFGHIKIDDKTYTKDVMLLPPRVLSPWWRREGHRLGIADLDEVLAYAPEVLVIGTGAHGLMAVPEETLVALDAAGIEVVVQSSDKAVERFGQLHDGDRCVAAAIHLTC